MWVPNNYLLALEGIEDSLEAARAYMAATVGDRVPRARQEAFLVHAPRMVESLRDHSRVAFSRLRDYSDYYPERPGGCPQGRGIEAQPLDARELGAELPRMRQRELREVPGLSMTAGEYRK